MEELPPFCDDILYAFVSDPQIVFSSCQKIFAENNLSWLLFDFSDVLKIPNTSSKPQDVYFGNWIDYHGDRRRFCKFLNIYPCCPVLKALSPRVVIPSFSTSELLDATCSLRIRLFSLYWYTSKVRQLSLRLEAWTLLTWDIASASWTLRDSYKITNLLSFETDRLLCIVSVRWWKLRHDGSVRGPLSASRSSLFVVIINLYTPCFYRK